MPFEERAQQYEVLLTRTYQASPEKVWRAWTDPDAMMHWIHPGEGFTTPVVQADLRVGGHYRIIMKSPAREEFEAVGVYREIVPNRRLVYTWTSPDAPGQETVVTVTLEPSGADTLFAFRHAGFPDPKSRESHTNAWASSLTSLELYLQTASTILGPLIVSTDNPRYFTVASDSASGPRVVYLTGSHLNNNFHDGLGPGADCAGSSEPFDYVAYLAFLREHGHNFIRLWRWEHFQSQLPGGMFHLCMTPQPWKRTGPGRAKDGKPKFDLSRFDDSYFTRLRDRVLAAGDEGIYVSVMLFEGFGLQTSNPPDNVEGHPFHVANNINGICISSTVDYQVLPLERSVRQLQEAYIRKVVDTVHDLRNILYEVVNESPADPTNADVGNSTPWQQWVISFVRDYELQQGFDRHAIGMTAPFPVADQSKVNDPLFDGPADWISPGFDDERFSGNPDEQPPGNGRWFVDPPANEGRKVIISDTDHYAPMKCDALWAWKSFVRGHNPILYDLGLVNGVTPRDRSAGPVSYDSYEATRHAMGDARRYADRMNLVNMVPRGDLTSTGYALANIGQEYLVLQPADPAAPFTVDLADGVYRIEWHSVTTRETITLEPARVSNGSHWFTAPFAASGPAVLYLKESSA